MVRGSSWKRDLEAAGLRNIKIVPVIDYTWNGINEVRNLLPRFYLHKSNCSRQQGSEGNLMPSALDCLEFYAKKEIAEMGTLTEKPIHNEFSHGCDGIRTFAEAYRKGMLDGTSFVAKESRRGGGEGPRVIRSAGPQAPLIRSGFGPRRVIR